MDVRLRRVRLDEKEVLANLLEKYHYEFSQYDGRDVDAFGLYGYEYLDLYWQESNRWAYFIEVGGKLAGFVMINDLPEVKDIKTDFSVAEFFIMYKYRRAGIGRRAFCMAADLHQGKWQLRVHPKNVAAAYFWSKVVREYTKGDYTLIRSHPNPDYEDDVLGDIFFFDNSNRMSSGL